MMKIHWIVLCLNLFERIQGNCDKCGSLLECRGLTKEDTKFVMFKSDDVIEVSFSGGNLTVISPNLFDDLQGIKSAFLVNNSIRIISDDAFANLKQLEELDLSLNKIQILKRCFFRTNPNLQWINLKENQISHIESGTFSRMTKLIFIDLSANNLKVVPSYLFYNNIKLLSVNLSNNKLRHIEDNILRPGLLPISINLCNNHVNGVNRIVFVPQTLKNFVNVLQQNASAIEEKIAGKVERKQSDAGENVRNVVQNQKGGTKYIFVNSLPIVEAIVLINASITTSLFLYGAFNVVMLFYRDSKKKTISKKDISQSILRRTYLKRKT